MGVVVRTGSADAGWVVDATGATVAAVVGLVNEVLTTGAALADAAMLADEVRLAGWPLLAHPAVVTSTMNAATASAIGGADTRCPGRCCGGWSA